MRLILILVLLCQAQYITSSGVSVHLALVSRIHSALPEDVKEYPGAIHAGAFFPDSFYNCFGLNDAAEDAHWPPFMLSSLEYFHKIFGTQSPRCRQRHIEQQIADKASMNRLKKVYLEILHHKDAAEREKAKKLKAFFYGILTHQIADSTWHSIRMARGLLKHLAVVEFDSDTDSAHSFLDTGGDFLLLKKLSKGKDSEFLDPDHSLSSHFLIPWDVPIDKIVQIYQLLGFQEVNKNRLNYCMQRGFAGLSLEIRAFKFSSLAYLQESPYLNDILDDYYLGGLEEIETSILQCFQRLNSWFEEENLSEVDPWTLCPGKIVKPGNARHNDVEEAIRASRIKEVVMGVKDESVLVLNLYKGDSSNYLFLSPLVPRGRFGHDIELGNFLGESVGLCAAIGSAYEDINGAIYIIPLEEFAATQKDALRNQTIFNYTINNIIKIPSSGSGFSQKRQAASENVHNSHKYGYQIKKLAFDLVENGEVIRNELLIISSPGKSSLDIFKGSKKLLSIVFFDEDINFEQVGLHVDLKDISGDGLQDIIVSSPFSGVLSKNNADQNGVIVVLDGKEVLSKLLAEMYDAKNGIDRFPVSKDLARSGVYNFKLFKPVILTVPPKLELADGYENFGVSFSVDDKFTLVGVNSIGSVLVYNTSQILSSKGLSEINPWYILPHNGGEPHMFEDAKLPLSRVKSKDSGQFGGKYIASGFDSVTGNNWALVSAHSESVGGCLKCGALYLYVLGSVNGRTSPKLINKIALLTETFSYDFSFSKFGYNGLVVTGAQPSFENSMQSSNTTTVYISSPRLNNSGAIWRLNISSLLWKYGQGSKGIFLVKVNEMVIDADGDAYIGIGKSMKSFVDGDGTTKLVVGMPDYGYSELLEDAYKLTGRVGIYSLQT